MGYEGSHEEGIEFSQSPRKTGGGLDPFTGYNIPGSPNKVVGDYFGGNLSSALDLGSASNIGSPFEKGTKLKNEQKNSNEKPDPNKIPGSGLKSDNISVETQALKNFTPGTELISIPGKSTNQTHPNNAKSSSTQDIKGDQLGDHGTDGLIKMKQGNVSTKKGKVESDLKLQGGLNSSGLGQELGDMNASLKAGGVESMTSPLVNASLKAGGMESMTAPLVNASLKAGDVEWMTSPLANATNHKGNSTEKSTNSVTPNTDSVYQTEDKDKKSPKYTATDVNPQSIMGNPISSLQEPMVTGIDDSSLPKFPQGSGETQAQYTKKANHTSGSRNSTSNGSNSTETVTIGSLAASNNPKKYPNTTAFPQSTMISATKEYSGGKLISNTTQKTALNTSWLVPANLTFPGIQSSGNLSLFADGDLKLHAPLLSSLQIGAPKTSLYGNTSTASNLNVTSKNHLSAFKSGDSLDSKPNTNLSRSSNNTNRKVMNKNAYSHLNKSSNHPAMTINPDIFFTPVNHTAQVFGDGQRHNASKIDVGQVSPKSIKSNSDIMLNATISMSSKTSHAATNISSLAKSNNVQKNQQKLVEQQSFSKPSRFRPVITEDLNPFFSASTTSVPKHESSAELIGSRFHRSAALTENNEGYKKDNTPAVSITPPDTVVSEDPLTFSKSMPRVTTPRFGGMTAISGSSEKEADLTREGSKKNTSLVGGAYRHFYPQYTPAIHTPKYVKTQQVQAVSVGLSFSVGFLFLAVLGMVIERNRKRKALNKRSLDRQNFKRDLEKYGGYFNSRLFANQDSELGSFRDEDSDSIASSSKTILYPAPVIKRMSMNSYAEIGRGSLRSYTSNLRSHSSRNSRDSYASSFGHTNEEEIAEFNETYGNRPISFDDFPRDFEIRHGEALLPEINQDRIQFYDHFNDELDRFPTSPDLEHDEYEFIKPPPRIYHSKQSHSISGSEIILDRFLADISGLQDSASIIVAYTPPRRRPS